MDLNQFKAALGDEKFAALQAHVTDLIGQRDTARNESITGRKGLKAELETTKAIAAKALEKLGIETADELESLPDAKGQVEALRQFETKLKRAERERDEAKKAADEANGKFRGGLQKVAITEALAGHDFLARDIVETYVSQRLVWEGDELYFKSDDGKPIPVKDGVAGIAKTRPELLKPTGTGGAGVRQSNAGGGGDSKKMTRSAFEAASPAERMAHAKAGGQVVDD